MTKETRAMMIENRIAILSARTKDNGNIIKKLKRELKILQKPS